MQNATCKKFNCVYACTNTRMYVYVSVRVIVGIARMHVCVCVCDAQRKKECSCACPRVKGVGELRLGRCEGVWIPTTCSLALCDNDLSRSAMCASSHHLVRRQGQDTHACYFVCTKHERDRSVLKCRTEAERDRERQRGQQKTTNHYFHYGNLKWPSSRTPLKYTEGERHML